MAEALERAMGEAGAPPAAQAPVLILGPPRSGRSALLMRAALAAAGPRTRVLFLAPCALQQLPGVPAGAGAAHALQHVQFLYPPSVRALLSLLAALPGVLPRSPALLLLDGLEHYVDACPCPRGAARLAALLVDTAAACATCRHAPGLGCQLIASICSPGSPDTAQRLATLVRYFPARCRLSPAPGEEGPGQAWTAHLCQPGAPSHTWTILFSPYGELSVVPAHGEEALGLGSSWGEGRELAGVD